MAKDASQYPITFPYGRTTKPYSPSNPHKGDDRAMPVGTPVIVNERMIGRSGNTGYSTGPHLHIQRYMNNKPSNPGGGGFIVSGAVVEEVGQNAGNGKFVRVRDADGSLWSYFHLNEQLVKQGDKLEGNMSTIATKEIVDSLAHAYLNDSVANNPGLNFYIGQPVENVINAFNNSAQRDKFLKRIAELEKGDAQAKVDKVRTIVN